MAFEPVALDAGVVELVDAPDSKSGSERSVGSIPTARTISSDQFIWARFPSIIG